MDKKVDSLKSHISDILELPKDIILDLPRITMISNIQINVENHKGILEYSDNLVKIKAKYGFIKIEGLDIFIKSIVNEEIVISGKIHKVEFFDK